MKSITRLSFSSSTQNADLHLKAPCDGVTEQQRAFENR